MNATQQEEDAYWATYHAEIEARALEAFNNGTVKRGGAARIVADLEAKRATRVAK